MTLPAQLRRHVGRHAPTAPRRGPAPPVPGLPASRPETDTSTTAPHVGPLPADDRPARTGDTATAPDPVIEQAGHDLATGQVDTDMRATAGLDAQRRARLVPGPAGTPPAPVT